MKGKTVLVTGYKGFLGSAILGELKRFHCKLIGVTRNENNVENDKEIRVLVGDYSVSFWEKIIRGVDVIYLFAAQTSAAVADRNPLFDLQSNLLSTVSLMQACLQTGLRPLIVLAGSVTQTGLTRETPIDEKRIDLPVTVYDVNKLSAEKYLQVYANQLGGKAVTLRLANLYGPGPKSSSADRGILNMMVRRAIMGEDLTVYGSGKYLRDYVYIDDVARAFVLAVTNIKNTNGKYYIVGSGQGHTILEMMKLVASQAEKMTGKATRVISVPAPDGLSVIEERNFVADTRAIQIDTGWKAETDLQTGIVNTIKYYLS